MHVARATGLRHLNGSHSTTLVRGDHAHTRLSNSVRPGPYFLVTLGGSKMTRSNNRLTVSTHIRTVQNLFAHKTALRSSEPLSHYPVAINRLRYGQLEESAPNELDL